ncbi:MAG: archaetidylserine decarboxylase [Acetobacter sp.]|nr:archaetidylserine decarboxylase [Acetobacter sp.]
MPSMVDDLKVKIQYFLPKKLISRAVGKIAAAELGNGTTWLVENFIKYYNVDMSEAEVKDIKEFKTFNAFFTRALKKGTRPVAKEANALVNPADGTISELGEIYKDAVLQAKGHYYSLEALLGGDEKDAKAFESGQFVTTYLSPKDYHRVHMPLDGKLEKMVFIPGDLFSVNPITARGVDNLFARNERVVCFFNHEQIGRFAVVMVGATIVASIETVFAGRIAPSAGREKTIYDYKEDNITLKKGEELGRFLLGSTTVCVFPKGKVTFNKELKSGAKVKVGEKLGEIKGK